MGIGHYDKSHFNERRHGYGVSNLSTHLFVEQFVQAKKQKLRITILFGGQSNPFVASRFSSQWASNVEGRMS